MTRRLLLRLAAINPQQFKLVSAGDTSLPPVPTARLNATFLRSHFHNSPPWQPELLGDRTRASQQVLTPAAVLVPLVEHANGQLSLLLTRRADKLRKHSGQIAFPGGKIDDGDTSPIAAALREAHEEVGLAHDVVEVIGNLPLYETGTGYRITPVVGLLPDGLALRLNEHEVAEAFTVPMAFLMDPRHHQRRSYVFENREREFFAMPWHAPRQAGDQSENPEYFIWGATAAMIRNLYRMLSA